MDIVIIMAFSSYQKFKHMQKLQYFVSWKVILA